MINCKKKAIYVKCCVIANGITDSQGDTLYTEDIKKIFTSFNNSNHFEIYHNEIPIDGVSLLENYISTADDTLGTSVVPKGSWLAVIRVDNPDIQEGLLTGKFKGVSLNNRIAPKCQANLQGYVRYEDITDKECVIPVYISFVESGANGYGLHVMDYPAYIQKSKDVEITNSMEKKRMDFKEFMEGLKSLIKQAEETPKEDEAAVKEEDPKNKEDEEPAVKKEETETAQKEEEEEEEEKPAEIKKADKPQEDVKDDNVAKTEEKPVEATEESLEERVAKLEKIIAELTAEKEESTDEKADETKAAEKEDEDEDTPKITKSEKVIIQEGNTLQNSNYYEMTGRDPITGVKIRNQSKIM